MIDGYFSVFYKGKIDLKFPKESINIEISTVDLYFTERVWRATRKKRDTRHLLRDHIITSHARDLPNSISL